MPEHTFKTWPVEVHEYAGRSRGAVDVRLTNPQDRAQFVAEFLQGGAATLWANDLCHATATFEDGEWKVETHES